MQDASRDQNMLESSKSMAENVEKSDPKINTPPTSSAELFSPPSSSKRSRLRAANLAGSPARGLGHPPAGFGAGLQTVPSPITTSITHPESGTLALIKEDDMRKPPPEMKLPGIVDTLKDLAPDPTNLPSMTLRGRVKSVAEHISEISRPESGPPDKDMQEKPLEKDGTSTLLDVYARRADQIGPNHRIPGIGHLGDLLPPPGWKDGDDPINEADAQRIFAKSRSKAREELDQSMSEASHLSSADQEKLRAEKNVPYQTQRLLDECLLLERVKLYKFWQDRKQRYAQVETQPTSHPQPLQPYAETSMAAYQRHQQLLVPASPHRYGPTPPLSGGTLNARIRFLQQGLHIPQASPMSPIFLDPGLVPQTLEAVYDFYARNQVIIMNMNNENERFLTQWSAKFRVPRPQNPVAPGEIPYITGERAAPFGSVHYGYIQQVPRPWTPSQERPKELPEPAIQMRQTRPSSLRQGNGKASSNPASRDGPFRHPAVENSTPERKEQAVDTPEIKKCGRTPKADKKKAWYDDEVAKANLPTSVISQAAMKAGMDFVIKDDRKQTPGSRGRRGMPLIDPEKGFAVSADAAKALIAKGAADARPRQQPRALAPSTNMPATITDSSSRVVAGHHAALYSSAGAQVTSAPGVQRDEDTISGPHSAISVPSSDTPDDPTDTSYGQKAQRKPAMKNTTGPPRKVASTGGKKRKSTEAAPSDKKRTRHNAERAANDE